MEMPTEIATKLVRDLGNDCKDLRNLSDSTLGELMRRIATALAEQRK